MNPQRPSKFSRFNEVTTPDGDGVVNNYFFEVGTGRTVYRVTVDGEVKEYYANQVNDKRDENSNT